MAYSQNAQVARDDSDVTMPFNKSRRITRKLDEKGVGVWKNRIRDAAKRRYELEKHWEKCVALIRGEHWKFINPNTGKLAVDKSFRANGIIMNLIPDYVHRACSVVCPGGMEPECAPVDPAEDSSVISAKQSTAALKYIDRMNDNEVLEYEAAVLSATFGTSFLADYWDDDAMASVPQPDYAFEEVDPGVFQMVSTGGGVVRGRYGDVRRELVLPFEIFVPEGIRDIDLDAKWVVRKLIKSRGYTNRVYPETKKIKGSGVYSQNEGRTEYKNTIRDDYQNTSEGSIEPPVHMYECFEMDDETGMWARYVICDDQHVNSGEPLHDHQPFRPRHWRRDSSGFWSHGLVGDLEKPQRLYNYYWSMAHQAAKRGLKPFLLLPKGKKTTPITNEHYTAVEFRADSYMAAPQFVNVPSIQGDVYKMLQILPQIMDKISGLSQVSQGKAPSNVRSSGMVQMLQERDQAPLAKIEAAHYAEKIKSYNRILGLIHSGYTEDRWIAAVGTKYGDMPVVINGDTAGKVGEVRILETTRSPRAKSELRIFLDAAAQSGLLNEGRRQERDELAKMLNLHTGAESDAMHELDEFTRIQVMRENEWFRSGRVVQISTGDGKVEPIKTFLVNPNTGERLLEAHQDQEKHLEGHMRTINSPEFRMWPPKMQASYMFHMDIEHGGLVNQSQQSAKEGAFQDAKRMAKIKQEEKMNPKGEAQEGQGLIDDRNLDAILGTQSVA